MRRSVSVSSFMVAVGVDGWPLILPSDRHVPPVRRRRGRGEESPELIPPEPVMGGDVVGAILHGVSPANHGYDTPGGHDVATRGH